MATKTAEETFPVPIVARVTVQDLEDVVTIALEGGINYWCRKVVVVGEWLGAAFASEVVGRGGELLLLMDDGSAAQLLTRDKLLLGIGRAAADGRCNPAVEGWVGEVDAEVADCIVQYALFGELVFG